jgi:predicted ferric reductase
MTAFRLMDVMSKSTARNMRPLMPPMPRMWNVRASDLTAVLLANGALIVGMWVRHGGPDQFSTLGGTITASGQLTALLGTYIALIALVLMSRSPWLDQLFGIHGLANAHRWLGFACVWLLCAHAALTTVGFALEDRRSIPSEAFALLMTYPYVLMATVGTALFVAVAVASVQAARNRLSYETWYGIHLYAYLGIALTFAHELIVGTDFVDDPVARVYWIAHYLLAAGSIVVFRFGQPLSLSLRHQLRVARVVRESPDVTSIYLTGRDLDHLPVRAGQFFVWRFLAWNWWWRAHPFSISAAPNGQWLRLTIKELGDDTRQFQNLPIGIRVFAEGPYGTMTGLRRTRRRVLLIAGGIGSTPLRALVEELPAGHGDLALIYRASRWEDAVLRKELDQLMRLRGGTVHYLIGRRGTHDQPTDPLAPASLHKLVPDIAKRDVFVCGPDGMMETISASLDSLAVPVSQVHYERFAY